MPAGMSGPDLVRKVMRRRKDIKVILTSGYPRSRLVKEYKFREEIKLLATPYGIDELETMLKSVLVD